MLVELNLVKWLLVVLAFRGTFVPVLPFSGHEQFGQGASTALAEAVSR